MPLPTAVKYGREASQPPTASNPESNNRAVINGSTGAIEQTVAYYPYGGVIADLGTPTTGQPYKFGGKELITTNSLNEYDFGARQYYSAVPAFTRTDQLCEDTRHLSPYLYCGNNPVNAIDPDGRSTWVTDLGDGKYKVVGGDLNDKDLNIYVMQKSEDGKYLVKRPSIGKSLFITSFYNSGDSDSSNGVWMSDAIIDTNDMSGQKFFDDITEENPALIDGYMVNAGNGGKYDFKAIGAKNDHDYTHYYRGMPFHTDKKGSAVYVSARDIGNICAGYMAAINGLPWNVTRAGFDGYQTFKNWSNSKFTIEGSSSQNAQFYGWLYGKSNTLGFVQFVNFSRSVKIGERNIISIIANFITGN